MGPRRLSRPLGLGYRCLCLLLYKGNGGPSHTTVRIRRLTWGADVPEFLPIFVLYSTSGSARGEVTRPERAGTCLQQRLGNPRCFPARCRKQSESQEGAVGPLGVAGAANRKRALEGEPPRKEGSFKADGEQWRDFYGEPFGRSFDHHPWRQRHRGS